MSGVTGIGIPALSSYIVPITVIGGVPARTHLPAKEHHDPDDERAAHDERRRQCHQIGTHTRPPPAREFAPEPLLLAL